MGGKGEERVINLFDDEEPFSNRDRHAKFFLKLLECCPNHYSGQQTNRILILYFCVNALDVLNKLDKIANKSELIDFIYSNQLIYETTNQDENDNDNREARTTLAGFTGDPFSNVNKYNVPHLTMTYSAIASLLILGDDLSRIEKNGAINLIKTLQKEDGSFSALPSEFGGEEDVRFTFCACVISFLLQDFSGINITKAKEFLRSVMNFDGGIGMLPDQESHGGPTYCAIASLALLGELDKDDVSLNCVKRFLVNRQVGGFNGRINKPPDTCYTFWCGGALQILGMQQCIDRESTREFLNSCESQLFGGFSKLPKSFPDVLHSHFSICGYSLINEPGLQPLISEIGITQRCFASHNLDEARTAKGTIIQLNRKSDRSLA